MIDRTVNRYNKSEYDLPNKRARKATKALNTLDRLRAQSKFDKEQYAKKAGKAKEKGNADKYEKYKQKTINAKRIEKQAKESIEAIKKDQKGNYVISEKDTKRWVMRGRNLVEGSITSGAIATIGTKASLASAPVVPHITYAISKTASGALVKTVYALPVMSVPVASLVGAVGIATAAGTAITYAATERVKGTKYKVKPKPIK